MKELTPEQIQENWNKLIQLIKDTFPEDYPDNRREKLLKMYHHFEDRMCMAPASGKEHYHNAHIGGYVEHVLNVINCSVQIKELWVKNGATINFTDEELIFAAMHHDLGKVGDMDNDYYIPQDNEWFRKNRGEIFAHNPQLQYMSVTDRALFLLGHFKIPMSQWEYIGLRLTDGLYEEANKSYYISYNPDWRLRSNIAYILHQADSMATHIENDVWRKGEEQEEVEVKERIHNIKKVTNTTTDDSEDEVLNKKHQDLFDELFGDK
tara:strand:- start:147 stop:941 length:795 start_codon:yes stop_codon:yes gene_type:complete